MPDLRRALLAAYPGLGEYIKRYEFREGDNLEFYPEGETDSPNPRTRVVMAPRSAPLSDVAADIVSHDLAQGQDQGMTDAYRNLQRSMLPEQEAALREQYESERADYGEDRPFDLWRKYSGQPSFFRGNAFNQWPSEMFTDGQRAQGNKLREALRAVSPH